MTDASVPGAEDVLDEEQASRQAAEANLAKELFEQLVHVVETKDGKYRIHRVVPRELSSGVLADALVLLKLAYPLMRASIVTVHEGATGERPQLAIVC